MHTFLLAPSEDFSSGYSEGSGPDDLPAKRKVVGTVLVVEDELALRETLCDVLQYEGYPADTAANGREALAYLRGNNVPALIILDLMMPVMNGWEFRAEQLRDADLAAVPVVILSAAPDLRQQAAFLNVADYLPKPIDVSRLLQLVQRYCG